MISYRRSFGLLESMPAMAILMAVISVGCTTTVDRWQAADNTRSGLAPSLPYQPGILYLQAGFG